jgi:hypothetical protein
MYNCMGAVPPVATIVTVAFPPLQSIAVVTAALVKANTGG